MTSDYEMRHSVQRYLYNERINTFQLINIPITINLIAIDKHNTGVLYDPRIVRILSRAALVIFYVLISMGSKYVCLHIKSLR